MIKNKVLIIIAIVSAISTLLMLINSIFYTKKEKEYLEDQLEIINYQGPPPESLPGEGFKGPTEPHP